MAFDIMQLLRQAMPNMLTQHQPGGSPNMLTGGSQGQGEPWAGLRSPSPTMDMTGANPRSNVSLSNTAFRGADTKPQGGGFMEQVNGFRESPFGQNLADAMVGWAAGSTPQESLGFGAKMIAAGRENRKGKKQQTANAAWLMQNGYDEEAATAVASDPQSLTAAIKAIYDAKQPKFGFSTVEGDIIRYDERGNSPAEKIYDGIDVAKPVTVSKDSFIYKDGEFIAPPGAGAERPDFGDVAGVRKELQALPSYKNFAQAAPIFDTMVDAAGRNTRASDLNLVYGLGKIFDPGSVVREGEMILVQDTAALPDWLVGQINRLNGGAGLQAETRSAIMEEAQSRLSSYKTMLDSDIEQYQGIADRYQIEPADIIPPLPKLREWRAPNQPPAAAVELLKQDPGLASQFDEKYGAGSAARALGGQ